MWFDLNLPVQNLMMEIYHLTYEEYLKTVMYLKVEIVSIQEICFTTSSFRRLIFYFIAVQSKDASNIMNSSVNKMHNIKYC